jgi:CheY-like chemotaxis protein
VFGVGHRGPPLKKKMMYGLQEFCMVSSKQPLRILLIEDNPDHAQIFKWALSRSRYPSQVTILRSGEEAYAYLKGVAEGADTAPHLVFIDFNLPRVDGREILQRIKEDQTTRRFPVIVLSSSEREEDVVAAYKLGASCFIGKSVLLEDLGGVLETIQHYWTTVAIVPGRK